MAVAFIDSRLPQAQPFYEAYRREPVSASAEVPVTRTFSLPHVTMESLLQSILANAGSDRDVLIVAHARDSGIAVPLVSGSEGSHYLQISRLAESRPDTASVASETGTSAGALDRLVGLRNQVRALRLQRVDFRGCNLGAWAETDAPGHFRNFFGAGTMTCLDLRSGYATFGVGTLHQNPNAVARSRAFDSWVSQNHTYPDGTRPDRFGLTYRIDLENHRITNIRAAAESPEAARSWIASRFGNPIPAWNNGPIHIHGILSVGSLIHPYDRGRINGDYASHIRTV